MAEVDGKVVGFILGYASGWAFGVPDSVGWIDTLGVDQVYQCRGFVKLLFDALINVFNHAPVFTSLLNDFASSFCF